MKKLIFLLILFNIGTNVLGNSLTVINNTDSDLNVQLCIDVKSSLKCEASPILKGGNKRFLFYAAMPLKSVTVRKVDDPGSIAQLEVPKEISQSNKFSIEGNSKIGYSLSAS